MIEVCAFDVILIQHGLTDLICPDLSFPEPMDESLPLPPDKSDVSDDRPSSPDPATGDPIGIAKGGWREEGASERSELRENMEADTSTGERKR